MVERKETTPEREARRKYEETHKAKRREKSGNFQTMIPRELYEEIDSFLKETGMTKVKFIRKAYEMMKAKYNN